MLCSPSVDGVYVKVAIPSKTLAWPILFLLSKKTTTPPLILKLFELLTLILLFEAPFVFLLLLSLLLFDSLFILLLLLILFIFLSFNELLYSYLSALLLIITFGL